MLPLSRRSESSGRLSVRLSTARESCDSATHRHLEVAGDHLERARDLRDLLHAVLRVRAGGHQLEVVDHDQPELRLARLEPARLAADLEHRRQPRVVDVDRRLRERVAGLDEARPVVVRQPAGAQALQLDAALGAHQPLGDLELRHLEREDRDRDAVVQRRGSRPCRARTPTCPCWGGRRRRSRLPGWRPDVIWSMSRKPVGVPVISPPDSYILVICSKLSRTSDLDVLEAAADAVLGEVEDHLLGAVDELGRLARAVPAEPLDLLADDRQAAQRRHLADDPGVVGRVRRGRHEGRDLVDPLLAADLLELAVLVELVGDRDRVDRAGRAGRGRARRGRSSRATRGRSRPRP